MRRYRMYLDTGVFQVNVLAKKARMRRERLTGYVITCTQNGMIETLQ